MLPSFAAVIASVTARQGTGPSTNTAWDFLFVTLGMIVFILLIAGLAAILNGRERRREEEDRRP